MKTIAIALAAVTLAIATIAPASAGPLTFQEVWERAASHDR